MFIEVQALGSHRQTRCFPELSITSRFLNPSQLPGHSPWSEAQVVLFPWNVVLVRGRGPLYIRRRGGMCHRIFPPKCP
jgi:hypothetical protein